MAAIGWRSWGSRRGIFARSEACTETVNTVISPTAVLRFSSITVAVLAFALIGLCKAADISHVPIGDGSAGFIIITGELNQGDEKEFNLTAQRYTKGAVLFASPGGNLVAGIEIGQLIRSRNAAAV